MNAVDFPADFANGPLYATWSAAPAQLALVAVSAATGLLVAAVYRFTSNQRALRAAAERARAQLLAVKLFRDDLAVTLKAQRELLAAIGYRLWHSLLPMLVLSAPVALMLIHLARWYEHRPLLPGETAIVKIELSEPTWARSANLSFVVPEIVAIETPPLRDSAVHAVYWRIRAKSAGRAALRWQIGNARVEKKISVVHEPTSLLAVNVRRPGPNWLDRLVHPGEPAFSSVSPVRAIEIAYAKRLTPFLGLDVPWWLSFVLLSMIFALLAGRLFGIRY